MGVSFVTLNGLAERVFGKLWSVHFFKGDCQARPCVWLVITSGTLTAELINLLAKDQTFNDGYSSTFSLNQSYGTDSAFFAMNSFDITKTYMLVSSSTRLFVPQRTIKTLFHDNSTLDAAWQRSLDHHQSGNMYLNIYEIEADGTVQRVGNAVVIPADTLANL